MNDMTPVGRAKSVPRHKQQPITIKSDRAARLLALLTRDGRSQARVIEEALEDAVARQPKMSPEEFNERLDEAIKPFNTPRADGLPLKSRLEIEAEIYDEFGLPR